MSEKACRECKLISRGNKCPVCNSSDMSDDFTGIVIIFDPENSEIARMMNVHTKGKYALRIR